jgi:WNK lysine deficient protein kinase
LLGRGVSRSFFVAYDNEEGSEVAWCQVQVDRPEEKRRIEAEVELLQPLAHKNVLCLFGSYDMPLTNQVVLIGEIMTSGTLKQ